MCIDLFVLGQQSPVSSESATTARASSVGDHRLANSEQGREHLYHR